MAALSPVAGESTHLCWNHNTYIHTYIDTYIHTYIHTYTHTYIHTYIHTYLHTYIHTSIYNVEYTYIGHQNSIVLMAGGAVRLWYLEPGKTFGFADASEGATERRRGADTAEGRLRLSWHLDGQGGYRAGYTECLNHDTSWRKLIFVRSERSWLLEALSGCSLGELVSLQGDGARQEVHACLLRCRCPSFYRRLQGDGVLPTASAATLHDVVVYLYSGLLPWELEQKPQELLSRVKALILAAKLMEIEPLQRICTAWVNLVEAANPTSDR